jgi:DNA polymerase-3 subunit alpha
MGSEKSTSQGGGKGGAAGGAAGGSPGTESRGALGAFTHLHLHTEYSLLDGGNQVEKLVDRLVELGMTSCAITDHGNMFGAVAFYEACKAKGIKPILGVEAYVTPPGKPRTDRTYSGGGEGGYHLVLLAMNNKGWENLLLLCSEAYLTGFYYKPRIDRELLSKHSEGLIAINGHLGSEIGEHLLNFERTGDEKHWKLARESAEWHKSAFGVRHSAFDAKSDTNPESRVPSADVASAISRFYVELQHHVPEQNAINKWLIKLAREVDVPLVCDNDAHFLKEDDYDTHDTLICISTGKGKRDDNRMRYPREVFVKSPAEMAELFAGEDYNAGAFKNAGLEALANTQRIAEACNVTLPIGANHAPLVRITLPKAKDLPKHTDAKYGGDLTAWYTDYCAKFELRPFRNDDGSEPSAEDKAKAKADCDVALRMLAEGGFIWRYGRAAGERDSGSGIRHSEDKTSNAEAEHAAKVARLERELGILANKSISAYFLIVWDFVNWGRSNGVPALARGSGVGTMVGYVLGLSNACPVRYGLLFERFTDPDRSEYPDIDIDLCQDGRGRVIDYVRRKYGHVAQIITFGTLKAKAAIKDVGRVLEIPLPEVDRITKLVPEQLNITIAEALKKEPELEGMYRKDLRIKELLDQATALEGHTRHAGVHAAGVIVATRPLHEIVPLYKQSGKEKEGELDAVITQWDGPTCEKMGLLKMDFLGLRTISIVARAKKLIRETMSEREIWAAVGREGEYDAKGAAAPMAKSPNGPMAKEGKAGTEPQDLAISPHPLDLDRLSYADQRVFEIFRRGETTGVFQFESGGMRRLLVEMKPDRLEDLIAANALFRPGPMDLIPDYNRRKHGTEDVPKVHDIVDTYTRETYGVMVYQEQVMQIVHGLGGIKLRDAYSLIKNISKKKHDKIEKERPKFIDGAVKQGLTKDGANDLFELILKFAGYGFNKSHSTGYAIVAYQTAYLKCFYPAQYMAAFLTYESQANKVSDWIPYLEDCRRTRIIDAKACGPEERSPITIATGVEVKPPDINLSKADFAVVKGTGHQALGTGKDAEGSNSSASAQSPVPSASPHIRFGLKAIKGIGEKAIDSIIAERDKSGPFTSLFDFCERVPPGAITKAMLESLIKCGAFDAVHGRELRASMVGTIDAAITAGQRLAQDKAAGQGGLFGGGAGGGESRGAQASSKPASTSQQAPLARVTAWPEKDLLNFEKEVLGFYVSSHPLERWKHWSDAFATAKTATLKEMPQDTRVVLPCMIQSVRPIVVRNGKSAGQKMAILTVEDHTGAADCVLFTDNYSKYGHLAEAERVVFVLGRLDLSRGDPQVIVDRLVPIEGVPYDNGKVRLFVDEMRLNGGASDALARAIGLLKQGDKPVQAVEAKPAANAIVQAATANIRFPVEVVIGTESSVAIVQGDAKFRVELVPEIVKSVEEALGQGMIRVVGGFTVEKDKPKPWENKKKFKGDEE